MLYGSQKIAKNFAIVQVQRVHLVDKSCTVIVSPEELYTWTSSTNEAEVKEREADARNSTPVNSTDQVNSPRINFLPGN